jgi:hypothetical protein
MSAIQTAAATNRFAPSEACDFVNNRI